MAIVSSRAPAVVRNAAVSEVVSINHARSSKAAVDHASMTEESGGGAAASDPLPIYSIALERLLEADDPLEEAVQHGWRVLTQGPEGHRHLVDLKGVTSDAKPSITRGEQSAALLEEAGRMAAEWADSDVDFEPRMLELPRIGVSALWLHSSVFEDHFVTIEPEPRSKSATDLLEEARGLARRRLESEGQAIPVSLGTSADGGGGDSGEVVIQGFSSIERGG